MVHCTLNVVWLRVDRGAKLSQYLDRLYLCKRPAQLDKRVAIENMVEAGQKV